MDTRNIGRECQKCGRVRSESDGPPYTECAFCSTDYNEFDSAIARLRQPSAVAVPEPEALPVPAQVTEPPPWRPDSNIEIPGLAAAGYLKAAAVFSLVLLGITAAGLLSAVLGGPRGFADSLPWGWILVGLFAASVSPCVLLAFASVTTNVAEIRRLLHERLPERPRD